MSDDRPPVTDSDVGIRAGFELIGEVELAAESRWRNGYIVQNSAGLVLATGAGGDGTLFGWDPEALVDRTAPHLVHPEDREVEAQVRGVARDGGGAQFAQLRVRSLQGRWVWCEVEYRPHPTPDSYPLEATVAFFRDVSAAYLDYDVLGLLTEMRALIASSSSLAAAWRAGLERLVTIGGFVGGFVWEHRDGHFWVGRGWSPDIDHDTLAAAIDATALPSIHSDDALEMRSSGPAAWGWTSDQTMHVLGRDESAGRFSSLMIPVERSQSDVVAMVELVSARGGCENEDLVVGVVRQLGDTIQQKDFETRLATAEQEFRTAFMNAPVGVAMYRPDGRFEHVNAALCEFLGRSEADLLPLSFEDVTHPEDRAHHAQGMVDLAAGVLSRYDREKRYLRIDGSSVWARVSVSPVRTDDGTIVRFISQVQDIDDRRRAEAEAKASRARLIATFEESGIAMALVRIDGERLGQILEANPAFLRLTRLDADEIEQYGIGDLVLHAETDQFVRQLESLADLDEHAYHTEARIARDSEVDERWVRLVAAPVRDPALAGTHAVIHLEDVTEQRRAQEDLARIALHDTLTDLPNRALIVDRIRNAQTRSERSGRHLGLLFIDLDKFKDVNDSLGHQAGDDLLKEIADRLRAAIRPSDTAARLGGDEFVVLCDELSEDALTARRELESVADRIHESLDHPFVLDGVDAVCTASIGMDVFAGADVSVESALSNADAAMYRAKARGRARSEAYTAATRRDAMDRLRMASELRRAIPRDQLHVAYQPIVDVPRGEVVGAEALLRWTHPELGEVPPTQFIEVAEGSDVIVRLGDFVLARVCADLAAIRPSDDFYVSVNVSARQLSRTNFVAAYRKHVDAHGLHPSRVALELTENVLMEAEGSSLEQLGQLRELGASVGVDDFGTGYASLTYLKQLPIDFVKVDRSFIDGLPDDRDDCTITNAVIGLARALDLRVIAEGVETEAQAAALGELDCGYAQGFLYGRPAPADPEVLVGDVRIP